MEKQPVWIYDENSEWNLFTNLNAELPPLKSDKDKTPASPDKKTFKPKSTSELSAFYFSKVKPDTKGAVIYTPQGYGIIQDFKPEGNIISVKVNNAVVDFKRSEVTYEIPLTLCCVSNTAKFEEIVHFPIQSTLKELAEKIRDMDLGGVGTTSKKLFLSGKELPETPLNLEKAGILPYTKILVLLGGGKPLKVYRFGSTSNNWCYGSNSVDGITFTTSKDIRVIGMGIYVPNNDKVLAGAVKLVAGKESNAAALVSKEVSMTQLMPEAKEKIYPVLFDRPVLVKAGKEYSLVCELKNGNSFYGSGGKNSVVGEGDVTFTFTSCAGSANGTSPSSGQIPEIYYYC